MNDSIDGNSLIRTQPYSLSNVAAFNYPVLISVPHSGRDYPRALLNNLKVPASHLVRLEDRYADRLAASAIASGFPSIIAQRPRAWIDLNRSHREIDPDMLSGVDSAHTPHMSKKVRGGLGILPRRLHGVGDLWREKWHHQQVLERISRDHEPYHQAVANLLASIESTFGCALLLDLHSMPSVLDENSQKIGFVVGDRFGRSCAPQYAELTAAHFRQHGYLVQTNHPYSGGYILERHGKPARNIHAFQLEVDRALYLDDEMREPIPASRSIAELIRNCCLMLAEEMSGRQLEAAE